MKRIIFTTAIFFASFGSHVVFEKIAEANDATFSSLSSDFKNNDCKNVTCYEVTQAAGATATMDGGVYEIYKTTRELEKTEEKLKEKKRSANSIIGIGRKARADISVLEADVSRLKDKLAADKDNVAKIYGVSQNDVKVIDRESKGIISGAFGERGGFALVIRKEENGKVTYVVSLKGTEKSSANDVFSDLDSRPKELRNGLKVPNGFYGYANSIINDNASSSLIGEIKELQKNNRQVEVVVTGHSLGGASAVLYSMLLQDNGINPKNIKTITFAAPPVANGTFREQYSELSDRITRIQNYGDAVIDLPIYTSAENAKELPFLGGVAKATIDNYHKYYVNDKRIKNGEDPFEYGVLLSGPKNGETLSDKISRLREHRDKLNGLSDNDFLNNSELKRNLTELSSIASQDGLAMGGLVLGGASMKDMIFDLDSITVINVQAKYNAVINALRIKNLMDKGGVHISYGEYYTFGKDNQSFRNEYEKVQASKVLPEPLINQMTNGLSASNSCITQIGSSPIGSAGCYFPVNSEFKAADRSVQDELDRGQFRPINEQGKNTYTDGTIVKAPLDIGLTWNQSTKLDLDSHTVTPSGDHVYFNQRGSLTNSPNTFLYRDSIPAGGKLGAEQTRITTFQEGEYRFYVYNYSDQQNLFPSGLPNSAAKVQLFQGGAPLTDIPNDPNNFDLNNPALQKVGQPYPGTNTFNVPTGQSGNAWYVFKLNTRTGILNRVDRFSNVDSSGNVPKFK